MSINGYASIRSPLTNSRKRDRFKWLEEAAKAFEKLKHVLVPTLILSLLDFSKQFVVETNALGTRVGIVLL